MTRKRVLIVDFDEKDLKSIANLIEKRGYEIFTATDGLKGLELYKSENPDLVILEPLLPKLHGFDLCNKIIGMDENVPVVIVTGVYRGIKCKHEAIHFYGAYSYIEKPVNEGELIKVITDSIGEADLEAEAEKENDQFEETVKSIERKKRKLDKAVEKEAEEEKKEAEEEKKEAEEEEIKVEEEKTEKKRDKKEKKRKREKSPVDEGIEKKLKDILIEFGLGNQKNKPAEKKEPKAKDETSSHLGEYILIEKIGGGGMGEIFKAKRKGVEGFEKIVAIKRIHPHLVEENERVVTMFIDEAKLSAQLSHPNIVHIYDLGKIEGYYYIAMEYVLGKDLCVILSKLKKMNKIMPFECTAYIGIKICEALDYSHRKHDSKGKLLGIVHRDVNPTNILVSYGGEVKLTDFGVAKARSKIHQTIPGGIIGKIPYLSPEQIEGKEIDKKADIYSLGLVLYEMVVGEMFFAGISDFDIINKMKSGEMSEITFDDEDIPERLKKIIRKSVKMNREERYQSALEMQKDLVEFLDEYVNRTPDYRDIAQFMMELFSAEIKEKGIVVDVLKETQLDIEEIKKDSGIQKEMESSEKETSGKEEKTKQEEMKGEKPKEEPPAGEEKKEEPKRFKMLLADNSVITQKVVRKAFSDKDYDITSLSNGDEVIKVIETITPDVALININLPKKDGYNICEYITKNKKLSDTSIFILKEAFEKVDKSKLEGLRFEKLLQKPFESEKLVEDVNKVLEKKGNV
ncbi:MAG: protein kinase domain-containing protein [Candidatus Aminicenantaceae bacterium]